MPSMQNLIDSFDWAATPIGPRESWPQSLRTSLSICLASRFPILIWWGPDLIKLYNDAYAVILVDKHPAALGAPGRKVWPEIWHIIGPMLDQVRSQGRATWSDDQLLIVNRHGYPEECYFTFSYSPILDETGGVGGIFTAVFETTSRVIGERRLDTLRQLAARASEAKTVEQACHNAADILASNPLDIPHATLYLRGRDGRGERVRVIGEPPEEAPETIAWSESRIAPSGRTVSLPLTIPGEDDAAALLVAGVSPHRQLDDEYRVFFTLVAGHIASAIASAKAYEIERQRAEALAELDRAKTAFFSNVSHEFRTPLTLMLGPVEDLLADGDLLPDETRATLELAHRNALRLLKLVNTLLDFSRIEAGRVEATYEPTDLAALTGELAGVFRAAIERAGLLLIVDAPPLGEPVWVDREMFEKMIFNLLSNALKFTFAGEIEVSVRPAGERVEVAVRDTGTGIAAEELPGLFERFHRVKTARGRTYEGSGIGLALVKELAALHGGSVAVRSEVDRGSTFTISIPRGKAHLPPDRIGAPRSLAPTAVRGEAYVEEALRWLPGDEPRVATDSRQPEEGRILLADDNADMRDYVRRLLESSYEVEAVGDGAAALEAARRHPPTLILTDVMMPGMDGFAFLRALRADERTSEVPVILLSARAGEESRIEGLQAGADDYLIKPFSARELLARVDAHIRLQRVRREAQAALRESEAKFSTAFDRTPLALTITTVDDGRLIDVNDGFVRLSGYSREEALGRTTEELALWVDPAVRAQALDRLRAGEHLSDLEARFRTKSGEERTGMVGAALVEINGRHCVLSSVIDITDRKRAEEAKDTFLSTLSHELRTPLTSGYGWIKLLTTTSDPETLRTGLRAIEESFVNQMKLVEDLLDISRIAAGKMRVDLQPLDLAGVIGTAADMVRPSAEAKGVALQVRSAAVVPVRGDEARLKQVFWNLLVNAVKFTPRGGQVNVDLRPQGASAVVSVRDTGEGIDPKFLPHVFDRFRQADASSSRKHGGLGLGLSIVSSLVATHGGTVRAESEGPGKGATFTVTLPIIEMAPARRPPGPAPFEQGAILTGARVLIVDDDDAARQVMTRILETAGAEVRGCRSAREAYETLSSWQPDLLISDLAMPNEDGLSLIRRLRDDGNEFPALAITAYVRPEDEARVREAGFQRHVAKPFDPQDLVGAVWELARG